VLAAVMKAAQLGLEPGINGRCYLIPYGDECQMVPGWKGLLELVNRAGRATAWTGGVFDGDAFDYELGDSPFCKHKPAGEDDPAKLLYTYAVGRIRGNEWPIIEVWPNDKLLRHRNRYNKVGKRHYSYDNWEMYARKIPLLQVLKYLPSSPELEQAIALSEQADAGVSQGLTIDGGYTPYSPPPPESTDKGTGEIHGSNGSGGGSGGGSPEVSFRSIAEAINKATSADELDVAKDLMRSIADEKQRAELDVEERAKRKSLTK
jgi:recombination protein RecT